jgi:phenylalanyl-tRNA synthetase beta chain
MKTASLNLKYFKKVKIFEIGKSLNNIPGQGPVEEWVLGGIVTSKQKAWEQFYEAKGVIELLAKRHLQGEFNFIEDVKSERKQVYAVSAGFRINGQKVGALSILKPNFSAAYNITESVVYFKMSLEKLFALLVSSKAFLEVSKFPKIVYDVSAIIDSRKSWAEIKAAIFKTAPPELASIDFFDEYRSRSIPAGSRSLAFHLVFQSQQKTLRAEEVKASYEKIIKMLQKNFGAEIRKD